MTTTSSPQVPGTNRNAHTTDELQAIYDQTVAFVAREVVPNGERWEADGKVPREILRTMGELGMLGLRAPVELGGLGLGMTASATFAEALGTSTFAGFEVTVLDDRSDYASAERFPEAVEVIAADFAPALAGLTIDASTYIILVTRAHAFDEQALQQIAASDARYIGMIGSRRRVLIVHQNLIAAGVSPDALHKVYAPLGIDLGAESVEEIALAAVAEVVSVKRGCRAQSLRIDAWGDSTPAVAEPAD